MDRVADHPDLREAEPVMHEGMSADAPQVPKQSSTAGWIGALARTGQPIVIYMAMRNIEHIVEALRHGGLAAATPAAVIVAATLPEQHIVITTLDKLAAEVGKLGYRLPGLIVIGEIVNVRNQLLHLVSEAAR